MTARSFARSALWTLSLSALFAVSPIAFADSEIVFLNRVDETKADESRLLVTRASGETMMFEAGTGCAGIAPGQQLRVDSTGPEPAVGSIVSDLSSTATCRVRSASEVLVVRIDARGEAVAVDPGPAAPEFSEVVRAIQSCLSGLGYDAGPPSGRLDERTALALQRYRLDKGHEALRRSLGVTLGALGMDAILQNPDDDSAAAQAEVLFEATKQGRIPRPSKTP